MKELLQFIVKGIVDQPDAVEINESEDGGLINLTLAVDTADMGKVIGKNGQIIRAIRTLLQTAAFKQNKRVQVILQEEKSES